MNENVLRNEMEKTLKKELRLLALHTRAELNLTQSKMAERYVMSEYSYADIESGKKMCGTLTTILLLQDQKDPNKVLSEIMEKLEKIREEGYLLL